MQLLILELNLQVTDPVCTASAVLEAGVDITRHFTVRLTLTASRIVSFDPEWFI